MRRLTAVLLGLALILLPATAARADTVYDWSGHLSHTSGVWTTGPNFTFHVKITNCAGVYTGGFANLTVVSDSLGRVWWETIINEGATKSKLSNAVQSWHYSLNASDYMDCSAHVWVTE